MPEPEGCSGLRAPRRTVGLRCLEDERAVLVVARGAEPSAVWDMEDEELLAAVNWQLAELAARRGAEVA